MDETIQRNILLELRVIRKPLAYNFMMGDSRTKQISELDSIGFQPKEAKEILGTTSNTFDVALSRMRRSRGEAT
jgi:hypothetical protein